MVMFMLLSYSQHILRIQTQTTNLLNQLVKITENKKERIYMYWGIGFWPIPRLGSELAHVAFPVSLYEQQRPLSDGRGAGGSPEPGTGPGVECRESSCPSGPSVGDPHACPMGGPDEPVRAQILGAVCGSVV